MPHAADGSATAVQRLFGRPPRAIDEREFELRVFAEECSVLMHRFDLGEPFDVSAPPQELVATMYRRLGFEPATSSR